MQEQKEPLKNLVKPVKEKYLNWESRNLLAARIFEYGFLILLVSFIIAIIFKFFNLIYTDSTSARYMLSALVQSQAAIVAIVVSLTLVAVQLTASAYSPRVIRIFMKNPDMWILLGFYGFSIFLGLFVLKMIRGAADTSQIMIPNISLEAYITVVYALGISTFMILFIYAWNIMGLLAPETIINRLTTEITKDNFLNSEEDPIQPIMDIIYGSIMKYDIATTRIGLRALADQMIKITDHEVEKEISIPFVNSLKRIGELAISKNDEESAIEVINSLHIFGYATARKRLEFTILIVVVVLGSLIEKTVESGFNIATREATSAIGELGKAAVDNESRNTAEQALMHLEYLGRATAEKGFRDLSLTEAVIGSLVDIGTAAIDKGLQDIAKRAAESLGELTIFNEKIVKFFVQRYEESICEEQDRTTFKKFKQLYEQELEKLRSEKKDSE